MHGEPLCVTTHGGRAVASQGLDAHREELAELNVELIFLQALYEADPVIAWLIYSFGVTVVIGSDTDYLFLAYIEAGVNLLSFWGRIATPTLGVVKRLVDLMKALEHMRSEGLGPFRATPCPAISFLDALTTHTYMLTCGTDYSRKFPSTWVLEAMQALGAKGTALGLGAVRPA